MPIQELRADNKRADVCAFYLDLQNRKGTFLIYKLLSSLRCLKRQQARNPADLKLLQKLSAPVITHAGTRQTCFPQLVQTLLGQPPCPHSNKAQLQGYSQTSHGEWDAVMGYHHKGEEICQDSSALSDKKLNYSFRQVRLYIVCKIKAT